ncbi:hypothetical protein K438DRAFT_2024046, partial [Mycena galopus ATCC 62051]
MRFGRLQGINLGSNKITNKKLGTKPDFGVARTKPTNRRVGPASARALSHLIHWGWIAMTARAACALHGFPGTLLEERRSEFTSNTMTHTYLITTWPSRRVRPQSFANLQWN